VGFFCWGSYLGKRKVISESQIRPRLPNRAFEVLGIAEKLLGYDRILVRCLDGFTRLCRIRGKMKRRVWIWVNDIVIVSPWDFQSDKRGDITYRYRRNQAEWLRNHDYLRAVPTLIGGT
jgi:translation initiation factor 1A